MLISHSVKIDPAWHKNCSYKTTFWFFVHNRKEVDNFFAPALCRENAVIEWIPVHPDVASRGICHVSGFYLIEGKAHVPMDIGVRKRMG